MTQKTLILILTLFLTLNLLAAPASAQTTPIAPISLQNVIWKPANEPYDGHIRTLLTTPAGNIFMGTKGGIFRSVDNGETWTQVNKGLINPSPTVRALAVSGSTLFAGTDEGLFRSEDNGNSWSLVNLGLKTAVQALASSRFRIFAGTGGQGIFQSTNNGDTWDQVGLSNFVVYSLAKLGETLFAGANGGGVFRSIDNGKTWIPVRKGLTNFVVYSLAISGSAGSGKTLTVLAGTAGGVFRSSDNGDNWTQVGKGSITTKVLSLSLAILRDIPATIFAGTEGQGVFRSTDEGQTWTPASVGLSHTVVPALAIFEKTVFAGTDGNGIFRSSDNGQTWAAVNVGLINTSVRALVAAKKTPATIFAGTDGGGIFRSADNGHSWKAVNAGLTHTVIRSLAIAASAETNIATATIFAGTADGVFRSIDNGETWTQVNKGLLNPNVLALAISETSPATIFVGTNGNGVFRSLNNGETWTPVNRGLTHRAVSALTISGSGKTIFAGTNGGGVFRSMDNGNTWTQVNSGLIHQTVSALATLGTDIFAGTDAGVFRSSDNGNSWTPVNSGLTHQVVSALATSESGIDIFAGTNGGGIFRSTDNGETWTLVNKGLTHTIVPALAISETTSATLSETRIFAGTDGGKVFRASIVISAPPSIISLDPSSLSQGLSSQKISILGHNFQHFQPEARIIFSGRGISVNAINLLSSTQLIIDISLAANAELGLRDVILINPDGGRFKKTKAFTVISAPAITFLSPNSMSLPALAEAAASQDIIISGDKFQKEPKLAFSGGGITVDKVVFASPDQLTASIRIDSKAELGLRDLTLTNPDGGSVKKIGGFAIISSPAITALNPTSISQGLKNKVIRLLGNNFQKGATVTFSGSGVAVDAVDFDSATQLTLSLSLASDAEPGLRDLTLTNPDGGTVAKSGALKVARAPLITVLSQNVVAQGSENQSLIILGDHFQSGAKVVFSGSGITVNSVTFNSATLLIASLSLQPKAEAGLREVTVTNPDGGEVTKSEAFTVLASPVITELEPDNMLQGSENQNLIISGEHFQEGVTATFSGSGIKVKSVSFDSASQLKLNLSLAPNAETGLRDITLTNPNGGSFKKTKAFTVISSPAISALNPAFSPQGIENKVISISGNNFQKGTKVVFSGSGVAVNSATADSATQLTVDINITPNADLGLRDVTLTNPDGGQVSKSGAFRVAPAPPVISITDLKPNVIVQGSENKNLIISGDHFQEGAKVTFSGSGITVNSVAFDSVTQLRLNLSLDPKAEAGLRGVTVANPDGMSHSKTGAFSVIQAVAFVDISVTSFPKSPVADGKSVAIIRFTIKDATDKPISGKEVKLSISGSGNLLTPAQPIPTDASGQTAVALTSTKAEIKIITASVEKVDFSTQVSFVPDVVSATKSTLSAVSPVAANSPSGSTATVALKDQHENLISNRNFKVSVSLNPADGVMTVPASPFTMATDAKGSLTFAVKSTKAELKTLKVTVSEVTIATATAIATAKTATETVLQPPEAPAISDEVALQQAPTIEFKGNQAPTAIKLSKSTILETSSNDTEVGILTTVDPDLDLDVGEAHSYQLKEDAAGRFKLVGNRLLVANSLLLDFETVQSPQIIVRSTDRGNLTWEQDFSITVKDDPEPPVIIKAIRPPFGLKTGGASVNISGENFILGVAVFIGGKLAEVASFNSTQLQLSLPPGELGAAEVKVINPGNNFSLISGGFTYVTNPVVNRIVSSGGPVEGGTEVKIDGEHFSANLKLTIGGLEALEVKRLSATEIAAKTPPLAPKASPAPADVVVTNLDTGLTGTLPQGFSYMLLPVVTKIQPAEGTVDGGAEVRLTGDHFQLQAKATVMIGGKEATQVTILSPTEIRAQTPAGVAGLAEVIVVTPGGSSKPLVGGFSYTTKPIIRSLSPNKGSTLGSTLISLKGENFAKGLTLEVGKLKAAEVVVVSKNEVTAKTPASEDPLSASSVEVRIQNSNGESATLASAFTYVPPPKIKAATPSTGPSNAQVLISGQNFDPKATVVIGKREVTDLKIVSPTEVSLKTPLSEPGAFNLTVINPDGQSDTLKAGYTYTKLTLIEVGKAVERELIAADGKPLGKLVVEIPASNLSNLTPAAGAPGEGGGQAAVSIEVVDAAKLAAQGFKTESARLAGSVVLEIEVKTGSGATATTLTELREPITIRFPLDPNLKPIPNVLLVSDAASKTLRPIPTVARLDQKPPVLVGTLSHLSFVTAGLNKAPTAIAPSPVLVAGTPAKIRLTGSDPDGDALSFIIGELPSGGSLHEGPNLIFSAPYPLSSNEVTYTPKAEYFGSDSFKFQVSDGATKSVSVAVEIQVSLLAPKLTSITPNRGSTLGGTQINIKGENFVSGTTLSFGNQKATSVNFISPSEIQAVTPAYSTPATPATPAGSKVDVVVANPDGKSATLSAGFTYYPPPQITAISPKSGSMVGGTEVSITGANFIDIEGVQVQVRFGNVLATEVKLVSETKLTAKTPVGVPGATDVSVTTAGGASALTAGFSYIPSPLILSLLPTRIPKGGGTLTITGENFAPASTVTIGGQAATVVNVSETKIPLTAPAAAEGSAAEAEVVVTNPDGQAATLKAGVIYVTDPIVDRIEPTSGAAAGGAALTLFGANLIKGSSVSLGGVSAPIKTVSEKGDMVTVIIPPAPLPKEAPSPVSFSVDVVVKNPDGKLVTLLGGFTYLAPPAVFVIEPATGSVAGGTPITIIGSNFKTGASLRLGEAIATEVQVLSSTKITAISAPLPAGSKPGAVEVVVSNPDEQQGILTASFSYLILPPVITRITPTLGPVSGGTLVTLRGENFKAQTTVTIGGQAATEVTLVSETQLSFKTPPNKTKKVEAVDIIVANPDGQAAALAAGFSYVTTPMISSIFPNNGSTEGGSPIRIIGANFLPGASVTLLSESASAGATATEVKVVSETELTAKTPPAEVGAANVIVKNPDGSQWTLVGGFAYLLPPEVRFITPDTGPTLGGTQITIIGSNFKPGAQLQIGEQLATDVVVVSSVKITASTKASKPGTFDVIVTNPDGLKGRLKGGFSYVIAPPIITGIAPNKGPTVGGIPVTIRGENFVSGATVKLGGQQLLGEVVNVLSETQISFVLPAGTLGEVDLTVANPDGQSASLKAGFSYISLPPQISLIFPDSGSTAGETAISIFGENFASGATLVIGGISASQVVVTPTKISAKTPPGVEGKADVTVTNPDGGSKTLKAGFNYIIIVPEQKRKAEAEVKSLEAEKKKAEAEIKALESERKQAEAEGETEEVKKLEAAIKQAEVAVKKLEETKQQAEVELKRVATILPPVITLVDTDNQAIAGSPKLIKAKIIFTPSITATAATSVSNPSSAKIFFLAGGKSFSVVDMTPMGAGAENIFVGGIPASAITLSGAAYYIKATDHLGQSSFFPAEAATNPKKAISLEVIGDIIGPELETNGSFTKTEFPAWKSKVDWTMISFPFELPNDDPKAVFAQLGKVEEDWQVYRYEGGADLARTIALKRPEHLKGDIEKFDSIQRGKAAWIYSAKGGMLTIKEAKATNPLAPFAIRVYSGLNMIGNPFRFSRFWNAETVKFSTKADGSDAVDILSAAAANRLSPILYLKPAGSISYIKLSADPNVRGSDFAPFPGQFEAWKGYLFIAKMDGYLWVDPTTAGPSTGLPSGAPVYAQAEPHEPHEPHNKAKLLIKQTQSRLYQNYPNPFNPETWIPYQLSAAGEVSLRIYEVSGRLMRSLNLGRKEAGPYISKDKAAYWDGRNDSGERVSSGIYFYELRAGKEFRAVKKMVILK